MQVQVNVLIRIGQRLIFSLRRACEKSSKESGKHRYDCDQGQNRFSAPEVRTLLKDI